MRFSEAKAAAKPFLDWLQTADDDSDDDSDDDDDDDDDKSDVDVDDI